MWRDGAYKASWRCTRGMIKVTLTSRGGRGLVRMNTSQQQLILCMQATYHPGREDLRRWTVVLVRAAAVHDGGAKKCVCTRNLSQLRTRQLYDCQARLILTSQQCLRSMRMRRHTLCRARVWTEVSSPANIKYGKPMNRTVTRTV